eukprot:CAMPEP_0119541686 /NCGR_PEP_ID=MMETSP1344-20130328/53115_1 /TAXON_ID=236787 /ORGANISM="Florenciella parvula, Strain CCMP2471" /LENGTH=39 /DNA_ID= /DNA_START= /DNA_END= /DNA_ORIENTATION=
MSRQCYQCDEWLDFDDFSSNQRRKGQMARCIDCVDGGGG